MDEGKIFAEPNDLKVVRRPGDKITGQVDIQVDDHQTACHITVRFFGEARTHFQLPTTGSADFSSFESIFDVPVTVFGGSNGAVQPIPPGRHVFPYVFTVPTKRFPSTCDLEDAHIKYGIEASVILGARTVKTNFYPIYLDSSVDLDEYPGVLQPLALHESKAFNQFCCCGPPPVSIQTQTDQRGYRQGETLVINVTIDNAGDTPVRNVTASLVQSWTLIGGKREKKFIVSLQAQGQEGVEAKQTATLNFEFEIPIDAPLTIEENCEIIKLAYGIQVEAGVQDKGRLTTKPFVVFHPFVLASPLYPISSASDKLKDIVRHSFEKLFK